MFGIDPQHCDGAVLPQLELGHLADLDALVGDLRSRVEAAGIAILGTHFVHADPEHGRDARVDNHGEEERQDSEQGEDAQLPLDQRREYHQQSPSSPSRHGPPDSSSSSWAGCPC